MRENCIRLLPIEDDYGDKILDFIDENPEWLFVELKQQNEEKGISEEHIYQEGDTDNYIHYVRDIFLEFSYILIHGSDMLRVARDVSASIPIATNQDLLAFWNNATTWEEKVEAILRLATMAPPSTLERKAFANTLKDALANKSPEVRDACVFAMAYRKWDELRNELEHLQKSETDELVSKRLTYLLSHWNDE